MLDDEMEAIRSLSVFFELEKKIDITNGGIVFDQKPILFHPESNEEIIQIIQLAKEYHRKIRVVGAMHSLNPCCLTSDYMMTLDRMNKVLEVGDDSCTVEGGITIRDLCIELEKYGLTIAVLGSIAEQTVSGAISTGTRGQVPSQGSLGSLVTHLEIVDGLGRVKDLTLEGNPDATPCLNNQSRPFGGGD